MTMQHDFNTFKAAHGTQAEVFAFAGTLHGVDFVIVCEDGNWSIYKKGYYDSEQWQSGYDCGANAAY